ncbi:MAG TPA: hypothetical protein VK737_11965 [Opitutales bacterium]|jgi:hypothetical protein|nr:hypothetical protein [Opitutales bacterium]
MKRAYRFTLGVLGAPPLGAVYSIIVLELIDGPRRMSLNEDFFKGLILYLAISYVFAILPSFVCMGIMERLFARGLNPRTWKSVRMAGWLGLASGLFINFVIMVLVGFNGDIWGMLYVVFLFFPCIGLAVGWTLGLTVKKFS